jgi:hypothetical protein
MSVLVIGEAEEKRITEMIAHAIAHPVRWETVKDTAIADPSPTLELADRKPGAERPPSDHVVLGNVRVAYSHEEQPAGMFRHISASVRTPGKTPHPFAMSVICKAFGFSENLCAAMVKPFPPPARPLGPFVGRVWLEEFDPGHYAVNIIELIEEQRSVH